MGVDVAGNHKEFTCLEEAAAVEVSRSIEPLIKYNIAVNYAETAVLLRIIMEKKNITPAQLVEATQRGEGEELLQKLGGVDVLRVLDNVFNSRQFNSDALRELEEIGILKE